MTDNPVPPLSEATDVTITTVSELATGVREQYVTHAEHVTVDPQTQSRFFKTTDVLHRAPTGTIAPVASLVKCSQCAALTPPEAARACPHCLRQLCSFCAPFDAAPLCPEARKRRFWRRVWGL